MAQKCFKVKWVNKNNVWNTFTGFESRENELVNIEIMPLSNRFWYLREPIEQNGGFELDVVKKGAV